MRDYLAWRLAFGVTTPSTNTVVQPEYDDMRLPGVTNHLARMVIPDMAIRSNDDFDESIRLIDAALEDAVDRVMDCKPNAFILGISALSIWGGNQEWCDNLKRRVRAVAGFDIPVALASDAVVEGLKRHGIKTKNRRHGALLSLASSLACAGCWAPHGYEIVRFNHMRGKTPASYSVLTARDMIEAIKSVDGPDVEAIVQFGANLPMARLADEAERWLDKPVISVNVATYWHACRMNGIDDKLYGFTQLFSRF